MTFVCTRVALGFSAAMLMTVFGATSAWAHHSSSRFDSSQTVTIDGVVTSVLWANPHVYLGVEQMTDAGERIAWEVETVGPSALHRLGWTRDSVVAGDRVSLRGNPARGGAHSLNLGSLQHDDRTITVMALIREYTSVTATPATGAASLDGTWAVLANFALITPFLPQGQKPALTAAGAAAAAAFDEQTMLPALQCVKVPAPYFMFILDAKQITTGKDAISIVGDYDGGERTIHMNLADHAGATPSVQGHSIGRWDGDTLVVDTVQFTPLAMAHAYGVPSGVQKHLIERLTRNADGTRIAYHFELSDPEFLAAPIAGDAQWAYRPDLELALEACDPGAARRFTGR